MVRSTIRMRISFKKQSGALEILESLTEEVQFEPGCVSCRLYREVRDTRTIMLDELWLSEENLQRHLRSERYRKILLVIEMAAEPPEIRFETIAQSRGLETLERARSIDNRLNYTKRGLL
jgi:quinol monooxygenase YgiN